MLDPIDFFSRKTLQDTSLFAGIFGLRVIQMLATIVAGNFEGFNWI
jgi:hypothetical protein